MARFFRLVKSGLPNPQDFTSPRQQGRPCPRPELERTWGAVSVFDTVEEVVKQARRFPALGGYLAVLEVPDGVERAGPDARGHFDLFVPEGSSRFLDWILEIRPIPGRVHGVEEEPR